MNVATPQDYNKVMKEDEKVAKYLNLASAICMKQHIQTETIPVITRAIGTIAKILATFIDSIDISNIISRSQISVITSTGRIFRDVLSH